jgi:hypothetical protein
MKMTLFGDVAPCSPVEVYRRFKGACYLYHQGDDRSFRGTCCLYHHRPDDRGSKYL